MTRIFILALAISLPVSAAHAADYVYTTTSGPACADIKPKREFGDWRCPGPHGYSARFFDEGNMVAVAFGPIGHDEAILDNDLVWPGAGKVFGDKVEWRIAEGKPYAAILRVWINHPDENGKDGGNQELLVAKVTPKGSCKVGFIDAKRPAANQAARSLADTAPGFRCGVDRPKDAADAAP